MGGGGVGVELFASVAASVNKPAISIFYAGCIDLKKFHPMTLRVSGFYLLV